MKFATTAAALTSSVLALGACGEPSGLDTDLGSIACSIPIEQIFDGGPGKDGIPALADPDLVAADDPEVDYIRDSDRVIGIVWNGATIAVPLNVGWWHEIVNFDLAGLNVAVTHCPLTGSSLAFDRGPAGGATFGVSGLLYQNNLVMYDRNQPESLWPQLARGARCGARDGTALDMVPVIEMTWAGWRSLQPDTRVVAGPFRAGRYLEYPYGSYDQLDDESLLFPVLGLDRRRPLKERVLGVPDGAGGIAFPFLALDSLGPVAAVTHEPPGAEQYVVLWDRTRQSAMAYRPRSGGRSLTLEIRDGAIIDDETGSVWDVDGVARSGILAGQSLEPVAEAHVAFWFGWTAFNRQTRLWTGGVSQ